MLGFLLWCILFVVCWPLALLALVLYPFVWIVCCHFGWWGLRSMGRWRWSGPWSCFRPGC